VKFLEPLGKPIADWLEKRRKAKQAEMKAEIRSLKLKRMDIKRQMKNARGKEREKLLEIYRNINNRILYLEHILYSD